MGMWWFNRVGLCGWVGSEFVGEGGDRGMVLRELATRTSVFVGGDEMVHRLMLSNVLLMCC